MISPELSKSKKTKKIRKSNLDCKKIWGIFEQEINSSEDIELSLIHISEPTRPY